MLPASIFEPWKLKFDDLNVQMSLSFPEDPDRIYKNGTLGERKEKFEIKFAQMLAREQTNFDCLESKEQRKKVFDFINGFLFGQDS